MRSNSMLTVMKMQTHHSYLLLYCNSPEKQLPAMPGLDKYIS